MRTIIPKNAILIPTKAKRVFKGVLFDTYQWPQTMYDGSQKTFEMVKRADTVVVIAIKDNKIILLDQEQPGTKRFYDFPAGRHDEPTGETEIDAAKRELLEETGMRFNKWRLVYAYQRNMRVEQFNYIFLAYDYNDKINMAKDNGEDINVLELDYDEVIKKINSPRSVVLADDKRIFEKAGSIEGLLGLPEYKA